MLNMLVLLLLQANFPVVPAVPDIARMATLYDELCLQTFPIDGQLDATMLRKGASALTAEQVRVTLRDDPGRGWILVDGGKTFTVILELPPFHACSVRANFASDAIDLAYYDAVVKGFETSHKGFIAQQPADEIRDGIAIHATSMARALPGGSAEQLMVIDQQIADPSRRAAGETGHVLRFVHQIKTAN